MTADVCSEIEQELKQWDDASESIRDWFVAQFPDGNVPDGSFEVPTGEGTCTRVEIERCRPVRIGDLTTPWPTEWRDPDEFDENHPGPFYALTIDEAIEKLTEYRAEYGGDTLLFMADAEPVCKLEVVAKKYTAAQRSYLPEYWMDPSPWVSVSDRLTPEEAVERRKEWRQRAGDEAAGSEAAGGQSRRSRQDDPRGRGP
jgi:hypothetical protein